MISVISKNIPEKGEYQKYTKRLENILLTIVVIMDSSSWVGATSAILREVSANCETGVLDFVKSVFKNSFEPQSDLETGVSLTKKRDSRWRNFSTQVKTNWELCKGNPLFTSFSTLLSICVVGGFLSVDSLPLSKDMMDRILPTFRVKHFNAWDFVDAVIQTIHYCTETVYACAREKSLRPLLLGSSGLAEYDDLYDKIVLASDSVKTGNLKKMYKMTLRDFENSCRDLVTRSEGFVKTSSSPGNALFKARKMKILEVMKIVHLYRLTQGMKRAPFALCFWGDSGQGKSTLMQQVIACFCASFNIEGGQDTVGYVNAADKFLSTWRSDKTILVMDDIGNTKANFTPDAPTRLIIQACNNVTSTAVKADVDEKGKVLLEPDLFLLTSNLQHMGAPQYSNDPHSVQRRVLSVNVKAKPQYCHDGRGCIDSSLVPQHDRMFDDIWDITVERAVQPEFQSSPSKYVTMRDKRNGRDLKDISFFTFLDWFCHTAHKHEKEQEYLVEKAVNFQNNVNPCPHEGCHGIEGACLAHDTFTFEEGGETITAGNGLPSYLVDDTPNAVPLDDASVSTRNTSTESILEERNIYTILEDSDDESVLSDSDESYYSTTDDSTASIPSLEPQIGVASACASIKNSAMSSARSFMSDADDRVGTALFVGMTAFLTQFSWLDWIDSDWLDNRFFQKCVAILSHSEILWWSKCCMWCSLPLFYLWVCFALQCQNVAAIICFFQVVWVAMSKTKWKRKIFFVFTNFFSLVYWPLFIIDQLWFWYFLSAYVYGLVTCVYMKQLTMMRQSSYNCLDALRVEMRSEWVLALGAVLGAFAFYRTKVLQPQKSETVSEESTPEEPQGACISPTTSEELAQRENEANPWLVPTFQKIDFKQAHKTCTMDGLQQQVRKSLYYAKVSAKSDRQAMVNILFLQTDLCVIPSHYFEHFGDTLQLELIKSPEGTLCRSRRILLSLSHSVKLKDSDVSVCYTGSGGSHPDLTKFLLDKKPPRVPVRMDWRNSKGDIKEFRAVAQEYTFTSDGVDIAGGVYKGLSDKTFKGMCGAVSYTDSIAHAILGMHVAGTAGETEGGFCYLLLSEILDAKKQLSQIQGVLFTPQSGIFREKIFDKAYYAGNEPSQKSPIRYIPENTNIDYHGTVAGFSANDKSTVVDTTISPSIALTCGVPNGTYRPEMRPVWKGYQKFLANAAVPGKSFPHDTLNLACRDYIEPLLTLLDKKLWKNDPYCRVLTDEETIRGIDGAKFIDAMKLDTAIGYPETGIKRNFFDITSHPDGREDREPHQILQNEVDYLLECCRNDRRANFIAKAVKKDEVLMKEGKCRIFQASTYALIFGVRKYFLPITRFLQLNPLVAECAVGLNSVSREWQSLHEFIVAHGEDRIFGGDYSKYDQKLPSQLILAAFDILISLGERMNYAEEDLKIMRAMAGEVVYAYVAVNGDLVSFTTGCHVSGNPLTVILNSICGSLNLRVVYFLLHNCTDYDSRRIFRDYVNLITYGDDNIGSVSPEEKLFNIESVAAMLDKYGQTYTMPDKDSALQPFLPKGEFEFLKRRSVYIEELRVHVGALSEESIFKRLHALVKRGKSGNMDVYSAENIQTSLEDFFFHGRAVYETRRAQLFEVAEHHKITHMVPEFVNAKTYDDRVRDWYTNYSS